MSDLFIKHVALEIPDTDKEAAIRFYSDFGLHLSTNDQQTIEAYCDGVGHPSIKLMTGAAHKALHHVQIGASAKGLAAIKANLERHGIKPVDAPQGCDNNGLWIREPQGILFHIIEAQDSYKVKPVVPFLINAPGHQNRINRGALPPKSVLPDVRPRRMGHVLMFTPDVDKTFEFLNRALGVELSDRSGEGVMFTHFPGGSEHHVIAFAKSSHIGFHHASFLVASPDEVGLGGQRMAEKGHVKGWGFGRHSIGSNFFHYVADPWGSYAEYYSDMDYIHDSEQWESSNWPAEDALHSWGPEPPADFIYNYESENIN